MSYFRRGIGASPDGDKPSTVETATQLANAKPKGMFDWFTDWIENGVAETPPIVSQPSDGTVILYPPTGPGGTPKPQSSMSPTTKKVLLGVGIAGGAVLIALALKGRR